MADVDDIAFETVAITWSQPEAAVMMSMFDFYGIPAYAVGRWHASVNPAIVVGLQGIQVRVLRGASDEARALLAEVAARPATVRPYPLRRPALYRAIVGLAFACWVIVMIGTFAMTDAGDTADWTAALVLLALPSIWLMTAVPPTRTHATFFIDGTAAPAPPTPQRR